MTGKDYGLSPLFSWRGAVVESDLPPTTRHVALTLSLHMNERGGSCFPSHATLARETGLNVDTVKTHLNRLGKAGWLTKDVVRSSARHGTRVYYTATVPQAGDEPVNNRRGGGVEDPTPGGAQDPPPGGIDDPTPGGVQDPCQEDVREDVRESPPLPPASGGRKTRKRDLPPEPLTVLERVDDFDAWWTAWPKKTAQLDAIRAWRVMLGWLPNIDRLIAATNAMEARTRRDHADDTNWQRWVPNPSTWLRRGDYLDDGNQLSTPVQVRRPCVLCGVEDPSPERCRGVDTGRISDIETECIWRTT